ncbi:unnamed protein product [Zymoseptoria tritici ST99CH_3D1]|uniref:Arf-GAP domain-containing protein n=2 Tax=Zymoseptoria tritici TaxID=1047171 RepID=A0A1X7RRM9_ZYMT9|nr:unnamed protein product [Zymoseptoria tritici ST99CH_3D7]SMR51082.1 unnamed protein product [Zymoseptoria tritici ST99CH_1E4]SMR52021.1 unnamed protein product [Zymoseptoria tritici ST99CH_3D1]
MSRRPPAGADRSEQNRATLKQLVKLESNKSCGDCKRNKHPRWASWNIGVFICIRCSGIHRGMGTHVSKVKSVDLDTWTDEQMASMLKWGNKRVNKYWEHKLAEGHVPNEAKIENFIRTKYDSRRWVMDGPMPDPSTLDDGAGEDDELPLNVVQEKVKQREASGGVRSGGGIAGPPRARQQEVDLFGDMNEPAAAAAQPARPSTTEPAMSRPGQPRALPQQAVAAKQSKPGESLLGLDFFGGASAAPARPSSTGPGTPGIGRSDLKQSILSLYASKPAAPAPQPAANAFGGMQSPASPAGSQSNASALSGMDDAFGSLSFSSPAPQQQQKSTPFANFSAPSGHSKQPSIQKSALSGGSFFDAKPAPPPKSNPPPQSSNSFSNDFGNDFGDFSSASPVMSTKSPAAATSSMGDLFDMSAPAPPPKPAPITSAGFSAAKSPPASTYSSSAFNLSQPTPTPAAASKPTPVAASNFSAMNSMDAWGSSDAWATPDPPAAAPAKATSPPMSTHSTSTFKSNPAPPAMTSAFDSGWGDPEPAPAKVTTATTPGASGFSVQQDEEFGGWSHASPVATNPPPKSGGGGMGGGSDDLFGNVWG